MKLVHTLLVLALSGSVALAQGPGAGPRGPQNGPGPGIGTPDHAPGSGLNMSAQQTFEGAITSVQVAAGVEYPSIVVGGASIKVAPVWFLLENDFEIKVGDTVRVSAAKPNDPADTYWVALTITKVASNATLTLRTAAGLPVWLRGPNGRFGSGMSRGPMTGVPCVDPLSIKVTTGIIDRITIELGVQHPSLVLKSAEGTLTTIELGPARVILASDIELKVGTTITVKYALASCEDELVALEIADSAGHRVVLRSDDGRPDWFD